MPAIFTHPRWANGSQFPSEPMDPPIFPETFAESTGTPLQYQRRAVSQNARDMVDEIHWQRIFRTGNSEDVPYTAYGPTPPQGAATLPRGPSLSQAAPNRPLLREMANIHSMQQINLQRQEDRRRQKGKGRGKSKDI